mgnify:CR=1 FL=1
MSKEWTFRIAFLLLGIAGGVIINSKSGDENTTMKQVDEAHARSSRPSNRIGHSEVARSLSRTIRHAKSADLPNVLYRVLTEPEPLERHNLMLDAFDRMDSTNWMGMYLQFAKITADTGRDQHGEWNMAIIRTGQVAGGDAVEYHWSQNAQQASSAIYGWAQVNPNAAMQWLDEKGTSDPQMRARLLHAVLSGQALANPDLAITTMKGLPKEERAALVAGVATNIIQSAGNDKTIEWMINVNREFAETDKAYVDRVSSEVLTRLAKSATWRNGVPVLAEKIGRIHSRMPLQSYQVMEIFSHLHNTEPLGLIDELHRRKTITNIDEYQGVIRSVAKRVRDRSPEQYDAWIESHPESPLVGLLE